MEGPPLADMQQKTFVETWRAANGPYTRTATSGQYLRRQNSFGERKRARGRLADCGDPPMPGPLSQFESYKLFWSPSDPPGELWRAWAWRGWSSRCCEGGACWVRAV